MLHPHWPPFCLCSIAVCINGRTLYFVSAIFKQLQRLNKRTGRSISWPVVRARDSPAKQPVPTLDLQTCWSNHYFSLIASPTHA